MEEFSPEYKQECIERFLAALEQLAKDVKRFVDYKSGEKT